MGNLKSKTVGVPMMLHKESLCAFFLLCLTSLPFISNGQTVMDVLKDNQETVAFARALEESGLDEQLEGIGPFTVFAPSSEAMNELTGGINGGPARVKAVLLNHIMTGLATERSIRAMTKATSLGGMTLRIDNNGDEILVNDAQLEHGNIRAGNGVIHIIDRVLR